MREVLDRSVRFVFSLISLENLALLEAAIAFNLRL